MIILSDLVQGSPEWEREKLGKFSASNCSKLITNDGKPSKQREGYLHDLAGEIITGKKDVAFRNGCTDQGQGREEEAVDFFSMINNVNISRVGVIYMNEERRVLCSPDGVIGGKEGFECKNPLAKTQVKRLLEAKVPEEYFAQIQFSLLVTGFKKWHFFSYVPLMKPLHIIVKPDVKFLAALEIELKKSIEELDAIIQKIK